YAVYLVYSAQYVKRLGALRLVGLATSFACLFCIAQFLLTRPLQAAQVDSAVIWLSVLNATLCTAVPVLLVMLAVERLGAATVAQTGMIGPLSTILMGVWLLGERLTPVMVGGTALVLTGIYVFTHQTKRQ
ncbi:MAG: DMT family transporter, partial [Comamonas sp.]|nr:DMT family transporter [Comamonas sp.]